MPRADAIARSSAAIVAFLTLASAASSRAGESDLQDFTQIERGRYLSVISDCASCHTVPGHQPFAGGRPIETPFGDILAPNLTPDRETGIGAWSEDEFDAAVRKGIGRGGSRLYPAMPYTAYTKMSRDDVLAIRAYLNTVPSIANSVVANQLPFPFNIRRDDACVEHAVFPGGRVPAGSAAIARMESGCIPCRGSRTLRRVPYSQIVAGRRQDGRVFARIQPARLVRSGHHERCRQRSGPMDGPGHRHISQDRAQPRYGRDRTDG